MLKRDYAIASIDRSFRLYAQEVVSGKTSYSMEQYFDGKLNGLLYAFRISDIITESEYNFIHEAKLACMINWRKWVRA